jgi:DNA-directed RNA polymerase subunit E'/Rpb7
MSIGRKINIDKNIYIDSSVFQKNIRKNILEAVKKTFSQYCDKEYGYILDIGEKINIIGNVVAPSGNGAFFRVSFETTVLKPSKGDKYTGKVCMIFSSGIFIDIENKLKLLIPAEKLGEYKYKDDNTFKKGKKTISVDTELEVEITSVKYEKQNFQCIGKLLS